MINDRDTYECEAVGCLGIRRFVEANGSVVGCGGERLAVGRPLGSNYELSMILEPLNLDCMCC